MNNLFWGPSILVVVLPFLVATALAKNVVPSGETSFLEQEGNALNLTRSLLKWTSGTPGTCSNIADAAQSLNPTAAKLSMCWDAKSGEPYFQYLDSKYGFKIFFGLLNVFCNALLNCIQRYILCKILEADCIGTHGAFGIDKVICGSPGFNVDFGLVRCVYTTEQATSLKINNCEPSPVCDDILKEDICKKFSENEIKEIKDLANELRPFLIFGASFFVGELAECGTGIPLFPIPGLVGAKACSEADAGKAHDCKNQGECQDYSKEKYPSNECCSLITKDLPPLACCRFCHINCNDK